MENIELLQDIIGASKEFNFEYYSVLRIRKYYDTSKCIYIDFTRLLDLIREHFTEDEIKECLLTEEEFKKNEENF